MPRIDRGNFGQDVAPIVPGAAAPRVIPAAFQRPDLGGLAQGVGAAADAATRQQVIENERAKYEADKQRAEAERAARIEEGTRAKRDALALGVELGQHRDAVLNDPAIPRERKAKAIDDWLDAKREALEPTYRDPEILGAQQVTIDAMRYDARAALEQSLVEQDQAATRAHVAESLDILGRQAAQLPDPTATIRQAHQHIEAAGQAAGWDAAEIAKIKQATAQEWTTNAAARRLLEDPAGTLDALRAGEYPDLDPATRIALEGRAQAEIEQRANRARIEAEAREARAERVVSRLDRNYYSKGLQPPPALVADATRLTMGTALEGDMAALNAMQAERAVFAGQPLAVQAAEIAALTEQATDPARGLPEFELPQYQAKQEIHHAIRQDIDKRGGLVVAAAHGIIDLEPLTLSDPGRLAEQLQERKEAAAVASTWTGTPVAILTPDETAQLSEQLKRTPPDQQKSVLQGFAKAVGDPETYAHVMAELAPQNGAAASAGHLLAQESSHAAHAADLILKGEDVIAQKAVALPQGPLFSQSFDDEVGNPYGAKANVRQMDLDNTRRVYAALSAQAGDYSRASNDIDAKRLRQAIEIATGGVTEYRGAPIILPRGMPEEVFERNVRHRLESMHDAGVLMGGFTRRQLGDLELETAAQNGVRGYFVRSGGAYLLLNDGQTKAFIDPTAPDPFAAAAGRMQFDGDVPRPRPAWQPSDDDRRPDGTRKGQGWLGVLERPDGRVSTEITIGVNIDGQETDIPALVPTLTRREVDTLLELEDGRPVPESIQRKAAEHARERIRRGLSPYAD